MNKNFFDEKDLLKNIPSKILNEINKIDTENLDSVFKTILESSEIDIFKSSMKLPELVNFEKSSVLMDFVNKKRNEK